MGKIFDLIQSGVLKAKRFLHKRNDERIEKRECHEFDEHMNSFDRVLLKEYLDLLQALEKEEDPIRRYRIMSAIMDIRAILEKR